MRGDRRESKLVVLAFQLLKRCLRTWVLWPNLAWPEWRSCQQRLGGICGLGVICPHILHRHGGSYMAPGLYSSGLCSMKCITARSPVSPPRASSRPGATYADLGKVQIDLPGQPEKAHSRTVSGRCRSTRGRMISNHPI